MNIHTTFAVTARVLTQLRRDPRTMAMLLVLPTLLISLLAWIYADAPGDMFSRIAPSILALLPFVVMFLVTSITTLRERTSGTLERTLSMPMGRMDLIFGYAIAFCLVAAVQTGLSIAVAIWLLGLEVAGGVGPFLLVAVLDAILGTVLGLFISAFAHTEFQAVQFMPAVVIPQMLLCGLLLPRDALPRPLELLSDVLPLSYAVDAMTAVARDGADATTWRGCVVILGFIVAMLVAAALTLQRKTD